MASSIGRALVFISITLYSLSALVGTLVELGYCSHQQYCDVIHWLALISSILLGVVAGFFYSIAGCPFLVPSLIVGLVLPYMGLTQPYMPMVAVLVGLAGSVVAKRNDIGECLRGIVATVGAVILTATLLVHGEELLTQMGLGGIYYVLKHLGDSIASYIGSFAPASLSLASRVVGKAGSLPVVAAGLGLLSAAASTAAGVSMLSSSLVLYLLRGTPYYAVTSWAIAGVTSVFSAAAILASAQQGRGEKAPLLPERPAGRVEKVSASGAAELRPAATSVPSPPRQAREEPRRSRCAGRRLREFVAAVRSVNSERWRRFFEECLLGRSIYGYRIRAFLGVGADGVVFRAEDEDTGDPAALKMILPETVVEEAEDTRRSFTRALQLIESLEREGASLRELSSKSPYIVRVKAVHTDAEKFKLAIRKDSFDIYIKNPPSIIMEYMGGGSLDGLIDRAKPGDNNWVRLVSAVLAAAASALRVVHENGYVHNDVKPANILLSAKLPATDREAVEALLQALRAPERARVVPKLSDLGVASRRGEAVKGFTPLYAAPEILAYEAECLSGKQPDPERCSRPLLAEPSQDIYSLGVVALQLYTGASKKRLSAYMQLVRDNPVHARRLLKGKAPERVVELIVRMLSVDPRSRPDASHAEHVFREAAGTRG